MPKVMLTDLFIEKTKPADKLIDYFDEKMPGLLLSINPGGRRAWRCVYYIGGASQSFTIGRYPVMTLKQARERARVFLANPQAEIAAAKAHRMADDLNGVADQYIKRSVAKAGLISQPEIERILRVYVRPTLGKRKVVDIKRSDVTHLLDKVEDENGPAMADGVLSVIRQVMGFYATRHDDYVPVIIKGMNRTSASARARKRILTDDELQAFWKAAGKAGQFGAIARLCLLSAQRRSKIATMKWTDLSDERDFWLIEVRAREKGTGGQLKLPDLGHAIICAQPEVVGLDYVFPASRLGKGQKEIAVFSAWSDGKEELDALMLDELDQMAAERGDAALAAKYKGIRDLLAQARSKDEAKAGAARQQLKTLWWTLHDLRRSARSLMSRAGVLPHISERVLGHVQPGVVGVYDRHQYRDEIADALARLANLVQSIVEPPPANVVPLRPEAA